MAAPRRNATLRLMAEAPAAGATAMAPPPLAIPSYLTATYWWAYVHPRAVGVFEREWLVSAILWGNYARLRDLALDALGTTVPGRTLQVACVYGNLTSRLLSRMAPDAALEVVDILPVQLANLKAKLPTDGRVTLTRADSSSLALPDGSVDQVLLFFLLHEQPEAVRRGTLAEAMRVVKPGGKVVIVDYHRPSAWHPLRLLMRGVFHFLEPFAIDLWRQEVDAFLPEGVKPATARKRTWFGGLYQMIEWTR
ncbi:rhodoquinone biosynthesis methyltransferase RquA [Ideonella sp. A 288]|uniref:rhodoquinone biosynthesis methyltransferase RquA n=1 Tax=Ideonella sp. A 288 TaxID=1962181 RepID=UPI001F18E8A9|nr:rhodoquinone biosynthesis methyltransferase RquA [Ideonella sp. A 288]